MSLATQIPQLYSILNTDKNTHAFLATTGHVTALHIFLCWIGVVKMPELLETNRNSLSNTVYKPLFPYDDNYL